MAERMQPSMRAVSTDVLSRSCSRGRWWVRGVVGGCEAMLGSCGGGGLECGFEPGESFFEDAGDGEQSEHGRFGDVAALLCVFEQRCAQE